MTSEDEEEKDFLLSQARLALLKKKYIDQEVQEQSVQDRLSLIENWVDELLHFYSEYFQDRDFYFHADYQLLEAILDSTLTNPFYQGRPPLETFLGNIKACFLGRELPSPTPELVASFNENFKNEPNFS